MRNKKSVLILLLLVVCIFNPFNLSKMSDLLNTIIESDGLYFINSSVSSNSVSKKELSALSTSNTTGKNYKLDSIYYPYYSFLTSDEQKLYKQIYAQAIDMSPTFVPVVNINVLDVNKVFEAVYNDHPELFWLETTYSYKYTINDRCVQITLKFNETANDIEYHKEIFHNEAQKIIDEANKLENDYEKEKYVHDILINSITYDEAAMMNQSAYSALVNKRTICAGYSRAFQYILIQLEIPTYYCVGNTDVSHAWNIVKLGNEYYNVDLTWDDNDSNKYKYFNISDKKIYDTHKRSGLSVYLPKCEK